MRKTLFFIWLALFPVNEALAQPPEILQHPQRRDVTEGSDAVFRVLAAGSGELTYQWFKEDVALDGETGTILELVGVGLADAGGYSVVVSDGEEEATSTTASLNVWAPLNNRALALGGAGDAVRVASHPRLQNPEALTVEFWMRPRATVENKFGSFVNKGDGLDGQSDRSYEFRWYPNETMNIDLYLTAVQGRPNMVSIPVEVPENVWTHVSVVFDGTEGFINVYLNGNLEFSTTTIEGTPILSRAIRQSSQPLIFGVAPGFNDTHATGLMDEVRIWNRARSSLAIEADFACKLSGLEAGLTGYWAFDDGGVDDFTDFEQHGTMLANAHTALISQGDLPVMGCDQAVFVQPMIQGGDFRTGLAAPLGSVSELESTDDLENWAPVGRLPDGQGRQVLVAPVSPGTKVYRGRTN